MMNLAKSTSILYHLKDLTKVYETAADSVVVLNKVNMVIHKGESLAITGSSGSGKSSLLHIMGTLAGQSSGAVFFKEHDLAKLTHNEKCRLRNQEMGFVFQFHHMLPEFSTIENVAMPAIIAGRPKEQAFEMASNVLGQVGLGNREKYNITLLSGGERQRAAIARAILNSPKVLLADEPTGNLDEKNGHKVVDLLLELNQKHSMTLIVVTHNPEIANRMQRWFELKSGDLYEQS